MHRRVVIVIFDGFQLFDLAGPADVFATASLLAPAEDGYRLEVTAVHAGAVPAGNGLTTVAPTALDEVAGPIDTLLVVGGLSVPKRLRDRELVDGIARLASSARRVTSVCNGSFLLAEAGLLAAGAPPRTAGGRRTGRSVPGRRGRRRPDLRPGRQRLDLGRGQRRDRPRTRARRRGPRPRGCPRRRSRSRRVPAPTRRTEPVQYADAHRTPRSAPLRELQAFIDANPAADLSVPALAQRAGMSERHFSRVFTEQTGLSPGRYVERSRADTARRLLEVTGHPLDRVARDCGLGAPETLYRVFRRHWQVSPGNYRSRFQSKES